MNTTYPSREELSRVNQPKLNWVHEHTEYVEFPAPSTPAIRYVEIVGASFPESDRAAQQRMSRPTEDPKSLLSDHFSFLELISHQDGSGLKRLYDELGWGIEKGNRVLRQLQAKGLVTITLVKSENPSGGRSRKVPSLTPAGKELLASAQSRP